MKTWIDGLPTEKDVGNWFWLKHHEKGFEPTIKMVEVCSRDGHIYLCQPCNQGFQKASYGTPLAHYNYNNSQTYFQHSGPIEMFPDYEKFRNI